MGCVLATMMALAMGPPPEAEEPPMAEVVRGNNRFALDLYGTLREEPGDLFFSPLSISTALAMTYAGARGETAEQMASVLHFPLPQSELHGAFASLVAALDPHGDDRLAVANRLWGQLGYDFRDEFLAITRDRYGAELGQVDFARETERARQRINAWVAEQTRGKIEELIQPGVLDPSTCLVLTNAIYFKGRWAQPFDAKLTREEPFHVSAGQQVSVPMMTKQGRFRYGEGDGLKVLELPYGEGDLAMVVLLPGEVEGLADLEARLNAENLERWLSGLVRAEVRVSLPRFEMRSRFRLAEALESLGMTLAFSPGRADFSGMASQDALSISQVVHEGYVDVNEEGTEAAAATGVVMQRLSAAPSRPVEFRADHPFVFLIRDARIGSVLFLGRLTSPGS